jgi:predicted ATP-dependent Lon-type protease
VETLVKTSHLLAPFPQQMIDTAFFDRFHAYIATRHVIKQVRHRRLPARD